MNATRSLTAFAALNGALAVLIGAFAAHGAAAEVKALLTTGGHYQMVHAVLALVCAIWPGRSRLVGLAGWLAAGGGMVFCLSLAAIGLLGLPIMGAVWLLLLVAALRSTSTAA